MRRIAIIHAPDRVREVCAQWQSSGAIGSAFAAVASGHIVTVAEFERDIWLTKLDSDSAYNDMRLLEDFVRQLQARYSLHIQGVSHGNIHYACLSIAHCVDVYRYVSDDFAYYGVTIGHGSISRYDARDCDDESHNDIERILSIGPRGGVQVCGVFRENARLDSPIARAIASYCAKCSESGLSLSTSTAIFPTP